MSFGRGRKCWRKGRTSTLALRYFNDYRRQSPISQNTYHKRFYNVYAQNYAYYIKKHGFNIDEYEETEEKKQVGLSAKEYKKKMEQEKEELNKKLEDMIKEYNELADRYNKLIDDRAELERKNREKAYEVMYQQEHSL